tara:strand:+ start:69 stop:368 length:300 start_codon:yes stop_codon:yes gene_type:complete
MDFSGLKHIKLKQSDSCPRGFNLLQDNYLGQSDSESSPEEEIVTDDDVDEDDCDFYLSESNNTTDNESIDEVPMKRFSIPRKEQNFPDELAPETDFLED